MEMFKLFIIIICLSMLIGCRSDEVIAVEDDYIAVYNIVFTAIKDEDGILDNSIPYIAIDGKSLMNISEDGLNQVLSTVKSWNETVIDESIETLEEKGMMIDDHYLEGILLEILSIEYTEDNKFLVHARKFKSRKGAVTVSYLLERKDGRWIIEEVEMTGIS